MMRFAGNFHPEWGYLAPAPSFMRTARIVLVATAVGATAGAGVVLSLVDRPATAFAETSVAARTLVRSVDAASTSVSMSQAPVDTPQVVQINTSAAVPDQSTKPPSADVREAVIAATESNASPTVQAPADVAAPAEAPAVTAAPAAAQPKPAVDAAPAQKKAAKKRQFASRGSPLALLPGDDYMSAASGGSYRDARRDRWSRDGHWDRWDRDREDRW
jgi:hypothetical protein